MPSTASDLLKFEKQATGENNNTWGDKANTAMSRIEEAIAEITNISVTASDYTLDDTQYAEHNDGSNTSESHCAVIKATGTLTGNRNVVVPSRNKLYLVWNATGGSFTLTVKTSSGSGIAVPQGYMMKVVSDGTNVEAASQPVSVDGAAILLGNLTLNNFDFLDANGNELVEFTETASAVNHIGIKNNTTTNAPEVQALGGDTNVDVNIVPKGTGVLQQGGTAVGLSGKHAIPIPAIAMYAPTTSGAAEGNVETSTNKVQIKTWDFDATADEYVQFQIPMPDSWNEGTVTAKFNWSHAATATNFGVSWGIQAVSFGDSDALDAAWGTGIVTDDTGGTTDDLFISAESSAATIAGTPAAGDMVIFRIYRDVSDVNDDMAIDARLHGITLYVTTDAGNDS